MLRRLQRLDAREIAELELRHAAADFAFDDDVRNLRVREQLDEVVTDAGLVVVDVARREDRDLAGRARAVAHRPLQRWRDRRAEAGRRIRRKPRIRGDAEHALHHLAHDRQRVGLVDRLHDDRNRRQLADGVGARQQPVASGGVADRGTAAPSRAASGAENRRSTDAAERTGTSSCSRRRTGSTGRRPSSSRPWRRRRPPSSSCRRRGRTASETRRTATRSDGNRGRCRRCAPAPSAERSSS